MTTGAPKDVFISFKNLDDEGNPTRDSQLARTVYDYLTSRGLRVFFSNISLEQLGVAAYSKAIDDALDAARVVVAVGTSRENLESKWVHYEWNSFFNDILGEVKPEGLLFGYVEGIEFKHLPRALRHNQVFVHSDKALETLHNFIRNSLGLVPERAKTATAYACYSHEDAEEVRVRIGGVEAAGTRVRTDRDLRAGDEWQTAIRGWIDEADFMILFWSEAAARSEAVKQEWRYALETRGLEFIRPIYIGEARRMPAPPAELAKLHFRAGIG